jgi:signal transduction histidine kinase
MIPAWAVWLAVAVLLPFFLAVSLPGFFREMQLDFPRTMGALRQIHLPPDLLTVYVLLWQFLAAVPFYIVALLIFRRNPGDAFSVLASIAFLSFGVGFSTVDILSESEGALGPTWGRYAVDDVITIGYITSVVFLFLFPDGAFVPRWTRCLAWGWTLSMVAGIFVRAWSLPDLLPDYGFTFAQIAVYGAAVGAQVYRYQYVSTPLQRQQTKWLVWSFSITLLGFAVSQLYPLVLTAGSPRQGELLDLTVRIPLYYGPRILIAFALGFAILRRRLWEADFFIHRSLVYGATTVALGAVFVGLFALIRGALESMLGGDSYGIAVAVSAIAVAALFPPTRERLQHFVDRRVYGIDPSRERSVRAAVAQERDRLARELHDSVTQSLYGLTLLAESWRRIAREGKIQNPEQPLAEMSKIAQQALKEMRLMVYELRPPELKREGLLGALHQRLGAVEKRAGVAARLTAEDATEFPARMEETLYAIATEALNNSIKHASASAVSVNVRSDGRRVELEISDDGRGFDPDAAAGQGGLGLTGMRERAEKMGGTLAVRTAPGEGTRVTARLPYPAGYSSPKV